MKAIGISALSALIVFLLIMPYINKAAYGLKTAATEKRIMKSCEGYDISRAESSVIYYTERDAEYVPVIHNLIATYYPILKRDMRYESGEPVVVVIYPTKKELYAAIRHEHSAVPMGAYTGGTLVCLSPSYWVKGGHIDDFIKNGPIVHELCHLIIDKKTSGNYAEWFSEGVALYYDNIYTGYSWEEAEGARHLNYKELVYSFKYLDERASYAKSLSIIRHIVETKGRETICDILNDLEKGMYFQKAINGHIDSKSLDSL